jgi:hypothetical protein
MKAILSASITLGITPSLSPDAQQFVDLNQNKIDENMKALIKKIWKEETTHLTLKRSTEYQLMDTIS